MIRPTTGKELPPFPLSLETRRLRLRPWLPTDAEALFRLASCPEVGPPAGWAPHGSPAESRDVIRSLFSAPGIYALTLKGSGRLAGCMGLTATDDRPGIAPAAGEAELSYWLGAPFWGQGLATEAARRLVDWALGEGQRTALWCGCYENNGRSRRVQQKCGFRYHHAVAGNPSLPGGRPTELLSLLTRDDHQARHALHLRPATAADAGTLRRIFLEAVRSVCRRDYGPEEVADWAACGEPMTHWEGLLATTAVALAVDGRGEAAGFAALRADGYLHSLFTGRDRQGDGAGSLLLRHAEEQARAAGVREIRSEVSLTAHPFFERRGYVVVQRQKRRARQLWLTNFRMAKRLD